MLVSGIVTLRGKCPYSYSGPYFPAFGLNTERYGEISPYLVQMRENTDQNNSECGHFLRSATHMDEANNFGHSFFM